MVADAAPDVESKARIFISYSRKDMAFADRLEAALKARGVEPLSDRTEIYTFLGWWKRGEVRDSIKGSCICSVGPETVRSNRIPASRGECTARGVAPAEASFLR